MFYGGEVDWRVFSSQATIVVSKHHIKHPVQAILHAPMSPDGRPDLLGGLGQGCDVEARFCLGFVMPRR
ncbi:hypothetical protein BQ8794_200298 [Mesorhizobium prunaredense]|uniref:Uncharacterized protein n=1 Tax=Mesorhizobium prunaredense TaxID=1631249 RepID=A0A1R3V5V1_9HYPH|nr:hypothetical protein BQ8794_200298 [Mesorhizobium prunaredense]